MDISYNAVSAYEAGGAYCEQHNYTETKVFYGSFRSRSCSFNKRLNIYGDAIFYRSSVNFAYVYGSLVIRDHSKFESLKLYSNRAYINDSHIEHFNIMSTDQQPVVYVNSAAIESLSFNGMPGIVYSDKQSKIGNLTNGELRYV